MIYNYIKTALRNFKRNLLFSAINLIGLAVGLTAGILILLYVYNELSYDSFHDKADRIYRMNITHARKDMVNVFAVGTAAMGVSLREEFPEVTDMVRFTTGRDADVIYKHKKYVIDNLKYADSTMFRMFNFKLLQGNPKTALKEPFSVILSKKEAEKIFRNEDPMGKFLRFNNEHTMKVTGIIEAPPANSQLQFDALVSFSTLYEYENIYLDWNGGHGYYTYAEFIPGFDPADLKDRLVPFMHKHINYLYNDVGVNLTMSFTPLREVHLFSPADAELETEGDLSNVYIFSAIAVFILLIACINFMNLATARSSKRAREVGVRKVLGASKALLRKQFLAESFLMSFLAMIIALILVEIVQPYFNRIIDKNLSLYSGTNWVLPAGILLLIILVGLFSGSYPAFYLSSFRPVKVLKGGFVSTKGKTLFRDVLVTLQFAITIALIISTIVIYRQVDFMKNKELGFDKENVVYLPLQSSNAREKLDVLQKEIENLAFVKSAGAVSSIPGRGIMRNGYMPEGYDESVMFHALDVDENLLQTLDIKIVKGEGFCPVSQLDDNEYLINQALADELGWDEPLGKIISRNGKHKVIGVVEDFHFAPLHTDIKPLVITNKPFDGFDYLMFRLDKGNPEQYMAMIEEKWNSVLPSEVFTYHFLDAALERNY
ncbi:MAG: ABC transporter permease, partial [Bacteroidota bacterium]